MRPLPLGSPHLPGSGPHWPCLSETLSQPGTGVQAQATAQGSGEMPALSCWGTQNSPRSFVPPSAQVLHGHREGGWTELELPCTPGPSWSAPGGPAEPRPQAAAEPATPALVWLGHSSLQSVSPSRGRGSPSSRTIGGACLCGHMGVAEEVAVASPLCPFPVFPAHRQALRNPGLEGRGWDLTSPPGVPV